MKNTTKATSRHQAREVRIFGLYCDAVNGEHFAIVRSGKWAAVISYLNMTARYRSVRLFIEGTNGNLRPLMA